jgi:hypothetical protein
VVIVAWLLARRDISQEMLAAPGAGPPHAPRSTLHPLPAARPTGRA